MISLPPNFDVTQFANQIFTLVTPFATIAALFVAYALIKKICNRI